MTIIEIKKHRRNTLKKSDFIKLVDEEVKLALEQLEPMHDPSKVPARPLYQIAREIAKDWKNVNYAAKPYLDAMMQLNSMKDDYGSDPAPQIVAYFLSNAVTWKGETAKRIKMELKARLKTKNESMPLGVAQKLSRDTYGRQYNDLAKDARGKISTKQSLATDKFAKKNQPLLNKNVEYIKAVLKMIPPSSEDYRIVQGILDDAMALREPTERQMSMISAVLGKYLKEYKIRKHLRNIILKEIKK